MRFDGSAVDTKVFVVGIFIQSMKNPQKSSVITPLAIAAVDGLIGAVSFGKISPGSTTSGNPENGIEHQSVGLRRTRGLGAGNLWLNLRPLSIAQLIPF